MRWLRPRALLLHVAVVVVANGCLLAGWWQVGRALSGNWLSYAYAVQWPAFAVIAVFAWWRLIHDEHLWTRHVGTVEASADEVPAWSRRQVDKESPELRAYNDYLQTLAEGNRTGR